jgi:cellulose biosynthesis protein BcsQ
MVPKIVDFLEKENTFKTIIPRNSKLNRAVMKGKSICDADKRSTSCKAYQQLAEEIIPYIVS